jgi:hypothetical protein
MTARHPGAVTVAAGATAGAIGAPAGIRGFFTRTGGRR